MPIVATPESGIPLPFDTTPEELHDFRAKAHALFATLQEIDAPIEVTDEDKRESHRIMAAKDFPANKSIRPGVLANLEALLTEWDHEVLDVHRRLRNYVTNKLLIETNDEDPKVRLKALELLGKTTGVNAFSDRIDINVTHRTIPDIEAELKKTLEMYTDYSVVEDDEEGTPTLLDDVDVDEELGFGDEDEDEESEDDELTEKYDDES